MEMKTYLVAVKGGKVAGITEFPDGAQAGLELDKIIDSIGTPDQKFDSAFTVSAMDEDSLGLSIGDDHGTDGDEMDYQGPGLMSGRED